MSSGQYILAFSPPRRGGEKKSKYEPQGREIKRESKGKEKREKKKKKKGKWRKIFKKHKISSLSQVDFLSL